MKALRRNLDEAIIGGVCSGLSEWMGISKGIIRIVVIFLAIVKFYITVPMYLLLWFFLKPRTNIIQ